MQIISFPSNRNMNAQPKKTRKFRWPDPKVFQGGWTTLRALLVTPYSRPASEATILIHSIFPGSQLPPGFRHHGWSLWLCISTWLQHRCPQRSAKADHGLDPGVQHHLGGRQRNRLRLGGRVHVSGSGHPHLVMDCRCILRGRHHRGFCGRSRGLEPRKVKC